MREPHDRDSSKIFQNPTGKQKLPFAPGRDTYEQDYLFFTFYSLTGCTVSLTLAYIDDTRSDYIKFEKPQINFDKVAEEDLLVIRNYQRL